MAGAPDSPIFSLGPVTMDSFLLNQHELGATTLMSSQLEIYKAKPREAKSLFSMGCNKSQVRGIGPFLLKQVVFLAVCFKCALEHTSIMRMQCPVGRPQPWMCTCEPALPEFIWGAKASFHAPFAMLLKGCKLAVASGKLKEWEETRRGLRICC